MEKANEAGEVGSKLYRDTQQQAAGRIRVIQSALANVRTVRSGLEKLSITQPLLPVFTRDTPLGVHASDWVAFLKFVESALEALA